MIPINTKIIYFVNPALHIQIKASQWSYWKSIQKLKINAKKFVLPKLLRKSVMQG